MASLFNPPFFSNRDEFTKNFTNIKGVLHFFLLALPVFFVMALANPVQAQLPNEPFEFRRPVVAADSQQLRFGLYLMGFSKNNEYFNKIADGYTLFGFQAVPFLTYQATSRLRIDAGVFTRKDFGAGGVSSLQPLFTIRYKQGPFNVLFGTLEGSLNHRLIEPIYCFERVMTDRLEEGVQLLVQEPRTFLDVWVNWERMIYRGSNAQEELSGGISLNQQLLENKNWQLNMPLQALAYHRGGQIDTNPAPLVTLVNATAGLSLSRKWEHGLLRSLSLAPYAVWFQDLSHQYQYPYQQGKGWYLNMSAATKHVEAMLSYWEGEGFIGAKSGALYQSVSSSFKHSEYTQEERKLLILRLFLQVPVARGLEVSARFEPFYDFNLQKAEFSHGLYLNYKTSFNLLKVKPSKTAYL
jgi:hypothetical protein